MGVQVQRTSQSETLSPLEVLDYLVSVVDDVVGTVDSFRKHGDKNLLREDCQAIAAELLEESHHYGQVARHFLNLKEHFKNETGEVDQVLVTQLLLTLVWGALGYRP